MVFNTGPYTVLPDNSILITANMQSETGFPSSHQLKSYNASKSRLKLAARAVLSADAGLLVLSLTVDALQGKMCQNSLLSGGGRSLGAKISWGSGRPWRIFFGFYKTRHILLSDSANCTVLRAVVLTQYQRVTDGRTDRQTDGQTDGIALASTALSMRASWVVARCKNTNNNVMVYSRQFRGNLTPQTSISPKKVREAP